MIHLYISPNGVKTKKEKEKRVSKQTKLHSELSESMRPGIVWLLCSVIAIVHFYLILFVKRIRVKILYKNVFLVRLDAERVRHRRKEFTPSAAIDIQIVFRFNRAQQHHLRRF